MRGLAVLAVVFFHAKESFFPLGYLGVDVFFVISGFVVTPLVLRIFSNEDSGSHVLENLRRFYKRRFFRLAPALASTLIISAVLITLLGSTLDHQRFARQGISTLLLIGNIGAYRYSGDYFSPTPNPLVHTWSLSVEEQIYILLPILLIFALYKFRKSQSIYLITFMAITTISLASFVNPLALQTIYDSLGIDLGSQFSFYSPFDRLWQFTFGAIAFILVERFSLRDKLIPKMINIILIIGILFLLFGRIHLTLVASSILASLSAFFVLISNSLEVLPTKLGLVLSWLGDRSYSIYLVHMPLMYIAKYSPSTVIGDDSNRVIQTVIAVFGSIVLGSLSFTYIENKFRRVGFNYKIGIKSTSKFFVATFAIPILIFTTLDVATKRDYWGLDRSIQVPAYAGALDPSCARDSTLGPPCYYLSPTARKTVLLVGDSHAGHISQALIDAAKLNNWNAVVWTHSGCPVTFKKDTAKDIANSCIEINKKMLNWVEVNSPDAIIVSQFVRSHYNLDGLQDALRLLKKSVNEVVIVENNPVFPDEKLFMVSKSLIMTPYEPPIKYYLHEMNATDVKASDSLVNWAQENSIENLSFNSLFCNQIECSRYVGSSWLYRDDDHFSVEGAFLTIPILSNYLNGI